MDSYVHEYLVSIFYLLAKGNNNERTVWETQIQSHLSQNTKHTPHFLPSNLFICIFAPTAVNGISLNLVRFTFNYSEKKQTDKTQNASF